MESAFDFEHNVGFLEKISRVRCDRKTNGDLKIAMDGGMLKRDIAYHQQRGRSWSMRRS